MMRVVSWMLIFLFVMTMPVLADSNPELRHVRSLQEALELHGVLAFVTMAREKAWHPPVIPSAWHVTRVARAELVPVHEAARMFGSTLVGQLAEVKQSIQSSSPDEALYVRVVSLFDLADWCASVDGYGNHLLAQESQDLAAIGLARLAVNLEYSMERIETLLRRLDAKWMSPATRVRVLNADAGAEIFTSTQEEDIGRIWASGGLLMHDERLPRRKDDPNRYGVAIIPIETSVMKKNLDFFQDDDVSRTEPSLASVWDHKFHERLVRGIHLQSIEEARALVRFRERIGHFPSEDNPASPYRGAKGAFDEAWRATIIKTPGMTQDEWNRELGMGMIAWRAYEKATKVPPR